FHGAFMEAVRAVRIVLLLALAPAMLVAGCGDDDGGTPDGGTLPDGGMLPDGEVPGDDGGTDPDGGMPDSGVVIRECAAANAPPLAGGAVCETTAGDANLLITADVLLADGTVLAGGQV